MMYPWSILFDISSIKRLGRNRGIEDYIRYLGGSTCVPLVTCHIYRYICSPFNIFANLFSYTYRVIVRRLCMQIISLI